jgi:hypothetical protein
MNKTDSTELKKLTYESLYMNRTDSTELKNGV